MPIGQSVVSRAVNRLTTPRANRRLAAVVTTVATAHIITTWYEERRLAHNFDDENTPPAITEGHSK